MVLSVRARGAYTLADFEYSPTAKKLGIDNRVPDDLLPKARGLVVIANRALAKGLRVNSGYRSRALTEAIYAARNPPETPPYAGPGDHGNCEGLDFDRLPGQGGAAVLEEVARILRADSVIGPAIRYTLKEGDHLHVGFKGSELVRIGSDDVA